jgi:hypothetical protein
MSIRNVRLTGNGASRDGGAVLIQDSNDGARIAD